MIGGESSLLAYYLMNDDILSLPDYKYTLEDLENQTPWERTITISLIEERIKKRNNEINKQIQTHPAYRNS